MIGLVQFSAERKTVYGALRESVKPDVATAIESLIDQAPNAELSRVNALAFAVRHNLNEEDVIAGFLARVPPRIVRPGVEYSLSRLRRCSEHWQTLKRRIRTNTVVRFARVVTSRLSMKWSKSHLPSVRVCEKSLRMLPTRYRGSSISNRCSGAPALICQTMKSWAKLVDEITLDTIELPPGEKVVLSLELPREFVIIFDPVAHLAHFIDVKGEPTGEQQSLSFVMTNDQAPTGTTQMRPGLVRIFLENRSTRRTFPASGSQATSWSSSCRCRPS